MCFQVKKRTHLLQNFFLVRLRISQFHTITRALTETVIHKPVIFKVQYTELSTFCFFHYLFYSINLERSPVAQEIRYVIINRIIEKKRKPAETIAQPFVLIKTASQSLLHIKKYK